MFDFKKIENIVAGIQAHTAEQKKQQELKLLVSTATSLMIATPGLTRAEGLEQASALIMAAKIKLPIEGA